MPEHPVEFVEQKPTAHPEQIGASAIPSGEIETLESHAVSPEQVTVIESQPSKHEFTVGQPLTEDDKARAVMNPFKDKEVKPIDPTITAADVPGMTEIKIPEKQPYKDQGVIVTDDGHEIKNKDFQQMMRQMISGEMINRLIKRYELQNINLEEEKALIDAKQSRLSKSRRTAVISLWNMRQLQKRTLAAIAKPMIKKESPTEEDVKKILDEVEEDVTNHENAAKIVVRDIVQRALANKAKGQAEVPAEVKEALESAKVDYQPRQFRGIFTSTEDIENPKDGDVMLIRCEQPDPANPEKMVQYAILYTYMGVGKQWINSGERLNLESGEWE